MSGTNPFRRKTTASQIYNTPLGEADGASPKGAEAHLTSIDTGQDCRDVGSRVEPTTSISF